MKATGVVRKTDNLGRIVIPKELRTLFGFTDAQAIEVFTDDSCIVLKKYEMNCFACNSTDSLEKFRDKLLCGGCISQIKNKH